MDTRFIQLCSVATMQLKNLEHEKYPYYIEETYPSYTSNNDILKNKQIIIKNSFPKRKKMYLKHYSN